jgi:hypothetical protein
MVRMAHHRRAHRDPGEGDHAASHDRYGTSMGGVVGQGVSQAGR